MCSTFYNKTGDLQYNPESHKIMLYRNNRLYMIDYDNFGKAVVPGRVGLDTKPVLLKSLCLITKFDQNACINDIDIPHKYHTLFNNIFLRRTVPSWCRWDIVEDVQKATGLGFRSALVQSITTRIIRFMYRCHERIGVPITLESVRLLFVGRMQGVLWIRNS